MTLTDDEAIALKDDRTVKSLGAIKVVLKEGVIGEAVPFSAKELPKPQPIYEKMKKAGSHQVQSGGQVAKSAPSIAFTWNRAAPHKFIFQYRPKGVLQALEIMPLENPTIVPKVEVNETVTKAKKPKPELRVKVEDSVVTAPPGNNTDPAAEVEAVQAQIQALEAQLSGLRELAKRKPEVKVEKQDRVSKKAKVEEIEDGRFFAQRDIIDLT